MNIGFVSTWYERGAAYVTKQYIKALSETNNIYVYVRDGEYAKKNPSWDFEYVTWGLKSTGVSSVVWWHFKRWIEKNCLDIIFFNEQRDMEVVAKIKLFLPDIKLGSYIDYYKRNTVSSFELYDFLICNTLRHYSVFKWHPQVYYVPWGTDISLFKPKQRDDIKSDKVIFFHSMGYSLRKGTELLIKLFLTTDLKNESKLIIHTQLNIEEALGYSKETLKNNGIDIIEKTVTAPGLYHLGEVYVYPTELDGLGLTIYEAVSCGLPIIGTDIAPINEIVNSDIGRLVKVEGLISREDGYYWPVAIIDSDDLYKQMKYYIQIKDNINSLSKKVRDIAIERYDWSKHYAEINYIFEKSKLIKRLSDKDKRVYLPHKRKLQIMIECIKTIHANLRGKRNV